ncbi:unnamed protein product [Trifolium pratense]|uniref:Uncharacterized protein n=1 Tax=Trifolium pratense TaxID=57577 RepID=A0ACB0IQ05_TRIPR|nr:unnamed protein product [Trifolium pratense]
MFHNFLTDYILFKVEPVISFYYDKRMSQYQAYEVLYQDKNSGSSSFEIEETDVGEFFSNLLF